MEGLGAGSRLVELEIIKYPDGCWLPDMVLSLGIGGRSVGLYSLIFPWRELVPERCELLPS